MPRSGEQARQRLQQAALDLYRERGYDNTTTAQIAARAGVTERTYFRHFPDKREVLFDGESALRIDLERGIAQAPDGADPLTLVFQGFCAAIPLLQRNRSFAEPRQEVITATPALRERALTKEASLTQTLAAALQRRGIPTSQALLAAQIGMAALGQAVLTWLDQPGHPLEDHLEQALTNICALVDQRPRSDHE